MLIFEKMAVLHTVMPSPDKNKDEYASYYILIEDRILLSEGAFSTFPYSVSRYSTTPGEVFGRGLAAQCMADILISSLSICAAAISTLAPSLNGFNVGLPL
jgi:hypothetical protein